MRITTKGEYGLRIMIELARHHGEGPIYMGTIAENQFISKKYASQLVTSLKATGLVRAVRGRSGGYVLSRHPSGITARDILVALEGPTAVTECADERVQCPRSETCPARGLWKEVSGAIDKVLVRTTLARLAGVPKAVN